jgi:hypothetical protein
MSKEKPATRRISTFLIAIILITVVLAVAALSVGIQAYPEGDWLLYLVIGVSSLALSTYMLVQTRRKTPRVIFKPYKIATTLSCPKCGFKNIREFERGDYIFKEDAGDCPKCEEKMMIASIYREADEKEKN